MARFHLLWVIFSVRIRYRTSQLIRLLIHYLSYYLTTPLTTTFPISRALTSFLSLPFSYFMSVFVHHMNSLKQVLIVRGQLVYVRSLSFSLLAQTLLLPLLLSTSTFLTVLLFYHLIIGSLNNLQVLNLNGNSLNGAIPSTLGNIFVRAYVIVTTFCTV